MNRITTFPLTVAEQELYQPFSVVIPWVRISESAGELKLYAEHEVHAEIVFQQTEYPN